jgi:NADH:ubiquinone oxidoreductase subunit E
MKHKIKICMGSACFARGNSENLENIENFIKNSGLDADIELTGSRCEDKCAQGPNITVDDTEYSAVDSNKLQEILKGLQNG